LQAAWNSDRKGLVADGFAESGEELGVVLDFIDFVLVWGLLVVVAIAAGVFPVNICITGG
jgi:hypothetical protein